MKIGMQELIIVLFAAVLIWLLVRFLRKKNTSRFEATAGDSIETKSGIETDISNKTGDKIEKLTRLKDLYDKGIITQEEFEEKKKQITQK